MSLLTASLARKHYIGELSSQSWVRKRLLVSCHGCVDVLTELVVLKRWARCKLWHLRGLIDASFFSQVQLVKLWGYSLLLLLFCYQRQWVASFESAAYSVGVAIYALHTSSSIVCITDAVVAIVLGSCSKLVDVQVLDLVCYLVDSLHLIQERIVHCLSIWVVVEWINRKLVESRLAAESTCMRSISDCLIEFTWVQVIVDFESTHTADSLGQLNSLSVTRWVDLSVVFRRKTDLIQAHRRFIVAKILTCGQIGICYCPIALARSELRKVYGLLDCERRLEARVRTRSIANDSIERLVTLLRLVVADVLILRAVEHAIDGRR